MCIFLSFVFSLFSTGKSLVRREMKQGIEKPQKLFRELTLHWWTCHWCGLVHITWVQTKVAVSSDFPLLTADPTHNIPYGLLSSRNSFFLKGMVCYPPVGSKGEGKFRNGLKYKIKSGSNPVISFHHSLHTLLGTNWRWNFTLILWMMVVPTFLF